jgi:IPTL-CTERM motif
MGKAMRGLSKSRSQALLLGLLWASATAAGAVELVTNGGFEQNGGVNTNVFTGWTETDQAGGSGSFFAQTGTTAPSPNPITVPAPPQGSFSAMSSQGGAGSHILSQNITIPASSSSRFSARIYINNNAAGGTFSSPNSLDYTVTPNQQFRIDIMTTGSALTDVGAGVLRNLYQTKPGDPAVSGYTTISADVSSFAGQTVRLRIAEADNQGNMTVGVDQVSIDAAAPVPTLSEWAMGALGIVVLIAGFFALRRKGASA